GYVEPVGVEPGTDLHQVLDQESLAAADVEHALAGLQAEMPHDVLGDRNPAPVVAIAAVALLARSVEVLLAEPERDAPVLLLVRKPGLDVAFRLRVAGEEIDLGHGLDSFASLFLLEAPDSRLEGNDGLERDEVHAPQGEQLGRRDRLDLGRLPAGEAVVARGKQLAAQN